MNDLPTRLTRWYRLLLSANCQLTTPHSSAALHSKFTSVQASRSQRGSVPAPTYTRNKLKKPKEPTAASHLKK